MSLAHNIIDSDVEAKMRPANTVMQLDRLGVLHPYRLSFMRILLRRICQQNWEITREEFELDSDGYGDVVYKIKTPTDVFRLVIFSQFLDPSIRSDRVIAEAWDVTMCLCAGDLDADRLERLRANVPLQEMGRVDADCIVLSRANKSARNFDHVISSLVDGRQPDIDMMAKVGYIYRTTAVYGSGKFGMADWQKVRSFYPDFASPFMAEMLVCYLIRQFSLDQANHVARLRAPDKAVQLSDAITSYVGIGNATGLGMAPYLLKHPQLIACWIEIRETAIARVKALGEYSSEKKSLFMGLCLRAVQHLGEIDTDNLDQNAINKTTRTELAAFLEFMKMSPELFSSWDDVANSIELDCATETQELVNSIFVEIFPELISDLEGSLCLYEGFDLDTSMRLGELRHIIETDYDWALDIDFSEPEATGSFWYRSEDKMEPRLGSRYEEPGAEKEMHLAVGYDVRQCYDALLQVQPATEPATLAGFLIERPEYRYIVRRIQTMSKTRYGDIRANVIAADILPIHLLRCKLSFFGVSKFDPRSRLWVRNTMFQGAPALDQLNHNFTDDWAFPVKPDNVG